MRRPQQTQPQPAQKQGSGSGLGQHDRPGGCARRLFGGNSNAGQLLTIVAIVVLLAGAHNIWVAQLIARCFRLAGNVAEGTRSGSVGLLTRNGGSRGAKVGTRYGFGLDRLLRFKDAPSAADARSPPQTATAAGEPGELIVTKLSAEHKIDAATAAQRLLALLKPETRDAVSAMTEGEEGGHGHASGDEYVLELAASLARSVLDAGRDDGGKKSKAKGEAAAAAPGDAAGSSTSGGSKTAAALDGRAGGGGEGDGLPYPWDDERYHSQQRCFLQSDESELCVYEGAICTDGINAFVAQDYASDVAQAAPEGAAAALAAAIRAGGTDKAVGGGDLARLVETAVRIAGGSESEKSGFDLLEAIVTSRREDLTPAEALLADLVNATTPGSSRGPRYLPDPNTACWDRRFDEPSAYEYSQCGIAPGTERDVGALRREALGGAAGEAAALAAAAAAIGEAEAATNYFPSMFHRDADAMRSLHSPSTDTALPLGKRRWGPQNSGATFKFKELPPAALWHDAVFGSSGAGGEGAGGNAAMTPLQAVKRLLLRYATRGNALVRGGDEGDDGEGKDGPFEHETVPGLRLARRTTVSGRTVDWTEGALWVVGLDTGKVHSHDPLKWMSKVGILFDAQRHNVTGPFGTHPRDGYYHHILRWQVASATSITMTPPTPNTARFRVGSQWGPLPPQDNVVFAGPGALELQSVGDLPPLSRAMLDIALQEGATPFFTPLRDAYNIDRGRLLCSSRGAVVGTKPKFFTGRADAWMFRQYGYMRSGLAKKGHQSHPKFSPRRILFVDPPPATSGNPPYAPLWNRVEVLDAIAASGLPFDVIPDILSLPFERQVELASGAGILVGPHSPSLAVAFFLPQHSAIVELTGAGVKRTTFRYLVNALDLHHLPVHSYTLPPCDGGATEVPGAVPGTEGVSDAAKEAAARAGKLLHASNYYRQCAERNISAFDSLLEFSCATAHAVAPVVVPIDMFKRTLYDAIDTVGAFSLQHPEWFQHVNMTGGAFVPPLGEIQWDQPFRKY